MPGPENGIAGIMLHVPNPNPLDPRFEHLLTKSGMEFGRYREQHRQLLADRVVMFR